MKVTKILEDRKKDPKTKKKKKEQNKQEIERCTAPYLFLSRAKKKWNKQNIDKKKA